MIETVADRFRRPLRSLRLSVTDRCNLRCQYCMPEEDYIWLPRKDLLSFEEAGRLVRIFTELGVRKLRLTGGEPLLRRDLPTLVEILSGVEELEDIALTTNGLLLEAQAESLKVAGLTRVTVSLDTLRDDRFELLARRKSLPQVIEAIRTVSGMGFAELKIDTVVLKDRNEDELIDLVDFGERVGAEVRFIEYMDVGGATRWSLNDVITKQQILQRLESHFGRIEPVETRGPESWAPAKRYRLPNGTVFGIIAATSEPFCRTCDRSRLTADGVFYLCLYAKTGLDLRRLLRGGASDEAIRDRIRATWTERDDRGAELRRQTASRGALVELETLRDDPHLEMHTRGG